MIKFFRRYNKTILALVTVFLMIAFVGGTALDELLSPDPGAYVIGTALGQEITQQHHNQIRFQTNILDRLVSMGHFFSWRAPWGGMLDTSVKPLDETDYMLLLMDLKATGMKPDLTQAQVVLGLSNENLDQFCLDNNLASQQVEEAVANYLMVQDAWQIARDSVFASEQEMRQAVREVFETVNASILSIEAQPLEENVQSIPEDQIASHFEKYKMQVPAEGPSNFGYLIPEQLRVEYIKINTSEIPSNRMITQAMARQYWNDHQREFLRPKQKPTSDLSEDAAESTTEEDVATTQESAPLPYYEHFSEAEEAVMEKLKKQAQLDEARMIAETIRRRLVDPWLYQEVGDDGYPKRPDGVDDEAYYQQVIESLKDELPSREPIQVKTTDPFTLKDAESVEEIGAATQDTRGGASGELFGEVAGRVQGLIDLAQLEEVQPGRFLALYQTASTPLIDEDQNLYLFRVIEVHDASAPESLEEVREQVVSDVRSVLALERAEQHAAEAASLITEDVDLDAAWELYEELDADMKDQAGHWFSARPFSRKSRGDFFGASTTARVADQAGMTQIISDEFVNETFRLLDDEGPQGVGTFSIPSLGKAFVVQLQGINPVTESQYEGYQRALRHLVDQSRVNLLRQEWFTSERIRDRVSYQLVTE